MAMAEVCRSANNSAAGKQSNGLYLTLQVAYLSVFVSNLGQLVLQAAVDGASIVRPLTVVLVQLAICFILGSLCLLLAPDGSLTHLHSIDHCC